MPKESLKDKVHGNVLDLGLSNIRTVVVEDLAALPKATVLDLSNNVIATLPDSFCSLTHLVKIDLSKNSLTELPDNFGNLWNLQHLDLLDNKLSVLPLSFSRLDKLEWLDLKDNPLEVELKKNAGDCKNEAQCRRCAQNILKYMKEKAQKERGKSGLCLKMVVTIILTIIFMTGMIYIIQVYCDREKKISSANTMVKLSLMRAMH